MVDSGMTVFPLFFHDGEKLNKMGGIEIHSAMEFSILQLMIMNRIRVPLDQILTYVVPLDENGEPTLPLDRPAFQVGPWTDFREVCCLKKRCFFIYLEKRENYQPAMATGYSYQPNLGPGHVSDPAGVNALMDELERLRSASVQTQMENYQPAMATGYSGRLNLGPGYVSGRPNLGTGYFSGRPNLGTGYFSGRPNLGTGYFRPNLGTGYFSGRPNLGPGYVTGRRPGYVTGRLNLGPGCFSGRLNLGPGYVSGRPNLGPGYVSDPADLNAPMKFDENERLQMANLQPQRENYERAMATRYDRPNFGPGHVSGGADLNPQMKRDELQGQSQRANLQTQGENYQTAMATGYSDPPNLGPGHVSGRADLNPEMKPDELQGQSQMANIQTDQSENYQTAMATTYLDRLKLGPGHVSGQADLNPQMKPDELQGQSQRTNIQTDQSENYQTEMATGYSDPPNLGPGHVSGRADLNPNPEMKPDELQGQSQRANIQTDQRENYQTAMATPYLDRLKFGTGHVSGRADLNPQMKLDELQGQSQMASVQNQRENHPTAPPTATGYSDRPNLEPEHVSDPNLSLDSFPPLEKSVNPRLQTKKKAKPKKNNCETCWNAQKNGLPTPFHHCVNDPVVSESGTRDGSRPT
ncbi:hypothetical protein ACP275_12G158100 [Erythranthe tilingii]